MTSSCDRLWGIAPRPTPRHSTDAAADLRPGSEHGVGALNVALRAPTDADTPEIAERLVLRISHEHPEQGGPEVE